jgi:hypothetical protein
MTVGTVWGREAAIAEAQRLADDLGGDATRVQALLIPGRGQVTVGGVLWEWPARDEERVDSGPAHLSVHLAHASERDLMSIRQWLQSRFGQGQVEVHASRPVNPIERMRERVRIPANIGGELAPEDQA